MSIKAKLEALIYAAEEPIGADQLAALLKEDLLALKAAQQQLAEGPERQAAEGPERQTAEPAEAAEQQPNDSQNNTAPPAKRGQQKSEKAELRELLKPFLEELIADSNREDRGVEVRQVAGGYRMSTKPEHHDVVRAFAKSLKPPIRLSLPALETLAVIAYKQPVTVPEISDIRGVDASGVIGTLLERKLITTAGRKAVVGRPMLYKTSKDFLMRFGLRDLNELPSLEEFEKLAASELMDEGPPERQGEDAIGDAGDATGDGAEQMAGDRTEAAESATEPTVSSDPHHADPHHGQAEEQAAGQIASDAMRENAISDATATTANAGAEQMAGDRTEAPESVTEPTVSSDPDHDQADEQVADQIASESTGG